MRSLTSRQCNTRPATIRPGCLHSILLALLLVIVVPAVLPAKELFIGGTTGISWSDAMTQVVPGDTITFRNGTYTGPFILSIAGTSGLPITVRAESMLGVTINATDAQGAFHLKRGYCVLDGFVLDGKFKLCDVLQVYGGESNVTIRNCEVRNSGGVGGVGKDGIDIVNVDNILIENCDVHHCLSTTGGLRDDSHGIAMDSSNGLTIRRTKMSFCSGDGFQVGSMHTAWDQVLIEDCLFWTAPLTSAMAGFKIGDTPGENAVDTKTRDTGKSYITIRHCEAWGFKNGISNEAAFNIKERVDCTLDAVIVHDSEIAFRLRDPADAVVSNCVAYNNEYGLRYESADAVLLHCTFGAAPQIALFQGDSSPLPPVKNSLFLGSAGTVPSKTANVSTTAALAVVNAAGGDFRLKTGSPAIDACTLLTAVPKDLPGNPRGALADAGAYEMGSALYTIVAGPGAGGSNLPPVIDSAAFATPNPVVSATTTTLGVAAHDPDDGPGALTFTWSLVSGPAAVSVSPNGTAAADSTTATFTASGTYSLKVTVSDGSASVSSTIVGLSVTLPAGGSAPSITTQPAGKTVTAGATATFSVVATGSPVPTYQWTKNGVNIPGATGTSYTTPATTTADSGSSFRVVVTNVNGSVTSSAAVLTVNPVAANPVSASVVSINLVAATGSGSPVTTTFTLTNTTGANITVSLAETLTWLTVTPGPSIVLGAGETKVITVIGDPTGLSGILTGNLTVSNSTGETRTIPVSFNLSTGATSGAVTVTKRGGGCTLSAAGDLRAVGDAALFLFALAMLATFLLLRRP